jgi:hypothetical protein
LGHSPKIGNFPNSQNQINEKRANQGFEPPNGIKVIKELIEQDQLEILKNF